MQYIKIKPIHNQILTTADKYKKEDSLKQDGLILILTTSPGTIKLYQKVVAVGPMVRDIKVGDVVQINPIQYRVPERHEVDSSASATVQIKEVHNRIEFPMIELLNKSTKKTEEFLLLYDRDVDFIIEDYKE